MQEIYAYFAAEYLEQTFLPLALQAAGLPPETRLDQLDALNLPIPNNPESAGAANDDAGVVCSERPLFCVVLLMREFAQTSPARQICRIILGLMWRDAVEFARAKDLWTSYSFIDDIPIPQEYAERFYDAEAQWEKWIQTDDAARLSNQEFLSDCVDQRLAGQRPLEDETHAHSSFE